jgi:PAS domain S-box-containing protein
MKDKNKTPEQLIKELTTLRRRIAEIEATERKHKQTIETLQESKKTLDALINSTSADSILILDAKGVILDLNKIAAKRLGKSREKLIGTLADSALPANIAKHRRSIISQILKTGREVKFEDERNGIWFDSVVYPLADKDGVINKVAIIARDITEHKQVEELLRAEHEQAQHYLNVAEVILVALNKKGQITLINRKGNQILGYKEGELLGKNWFENFVPLSARRQVKSVFRKLMVGEMKMTKFHENPILTKSGNELIISWHNTLLKDNQSTIIGTLSSGIDVTERIKAEGSLKAAHERLNHLLSSTSAAIYTCKTSGDYGATSITDNVEQITGYEPRAFIEDSSFWLDRIHPDDKPRIMKELRSIFKKGSHTYEYRFRHKDGNYIWICDNMRLITDERKKPREIVGNWIDITALKLVEMNLEKSEEKYRTVAELSPDGIAIAAQGRHVFANQSLAKIYGVADPAQLLGKPLMDYIHPDYRKIVRKRMTEQIKRGVQAPMLEEKMLRADGSTIYTEVAATPIEYEGKQAVMAIIRDITGRKQADKALEESEKKYKSLFDDDLTGDFILSGNGKITMCNPSFVKIFGYDSIAQLIGQSKKSFHVDPSEWKNLLADLKKRKKLENYQTSLRRKDGQLIHLIENIIATFDANGEIVEIKGYAYDDTQRYQAEEKLRESEERFREILNGMSDTAWVINFEGKFIDVNHAAVQLLGYSREELLSMGPPDIDCTLDLKKIKVLIRNMPSDKIQVFETAHTAKDGKSIPVEIKSSLIMYGGKQAILSVARDITERKQAEKELRDSRLLLQTVLDSIPSAVFWKDRDSIYLGGNRAWLKATGLKSSDEVVGKTDYDLPWKKEQADEYRKDDKRIMKTGIPQYNIIESYRRIDGITAWAATNKVPLRNTEGNVVGILGTYEDITVRKQAEDALRESEERFRTVFESAEDIIFIKDRDLRFTFVNPAMTRYHGIPAAKMIGKTSQEVFGDEPTSKIREDDVHVLNGEIIDKEQFAPIKERSVVDHIIKVPMRNSAGEIVGLCGIARDITERKQAEEALKESENRFRTLFEAIPDSVIVHDDTGTILHINEIGAHRLEWTAKDLVGKNVREIVTPENGVAIPDHVKETHTVGWSRFETKYVARSGWQYQAEVSERPIKFGKQKAILSVARDISERKRVELALQESEKKFRQFFENEPTYCYMISPEGTISDVNKAALNILGYAKKDLIGKPLKMIYAPEALPKMEQLFTRWEKGGKISHEEMIIITKKGERRTVLLSADAIKDANGKIIHSISVQSDITERKQADDAMMETKQRYQTIVDNINDALYIFDFQGNIIEVNENACKMLGYNRQELIGANLSKIDNRENGEKIPERIKIVLSHKSLLFEGNYIRKDGTTLPVEVSVKVVSYEGNGVIQGFARDISERKRAEKVVSDSEERFRTLVENASEGIFVQTDYRFAYINKAALHIFGAERPEQLLGELVMDRFHPDFRVQVLERIRLLNEEKKSVPTIEQIYLRLDGSEAQVEVSAAPIIYNEKNGAVVFVRDITERKQSEQALRESEERFRKFADEAAFEGLLIHDPAGKVIDVNKQFATMHGYEVSEIMSMTPLIKLMAPKSRDRVLKYIKEGYEGSYEATALRKDGSTFPYEAQSRMIPYRGKIVRAVAIRDISERKKAEEELQCSYREIREMLLTTVDALASTVEMKDQYTAGHQPKVTALACAIAEEMGLSQDQIEGIRMAGSIHDIGKLVVPAEILNKPGRLTDIQYEMVKIHPEAGYDIVKRIAFPWPVAEIIRQHHELLNGSGYPHGLAGDQIMVEAKIMTVANVVEAMTSHRPYRPAYDIAVALEEITKNRGVLYDPVIVDACLKLFKEKKFLLEGMAPPTPTPVS